MNVLVLGGTRGLGRAVAEAAQAAGHVLTIMARYPRDFAGSVTGVRMVMGDVVDPIDVERAVQGQDIVVWTVRAATNREVVTTYSRGTHNVLMAMQTHRVRRFVVVNGVASSRRQALVRRDVVRSMVEEAQRQQVQVRASSTEWTLVCPAPLTDRPPTGLFQALIAPPEGHVRPIARGDVASFVVDNFATADYQRAMVYLTA